MNLTNFLYKRLDAINDIIDDVGFIEGTHIIFDLIEKCINNGGRIITCGNGGSASEASHFTTELMGRFKKNRRAINSVCLNSDSALITCIGNDFGFDKIFLRQLEGLNISGKDILFCFSTSGNSENVLQALQSNLHCETVLITGNKNGACREFADYELCIPSDNTAVIQEITLGLIHYWCERIDEMF
jgi:D-sedoheptulose 7-phosphate isomerase